VLANEWHSLAGLEALKAGAIAIRTFAYRELGCGAYTGKNLTEPGSPPVVSRVLDNRSQAFKLKLPDGTFKQNPITEAHTLARSQTDYVFLYRADSGFACAKYNTTTRNPTQACTSSDCSQPGDRETLASTVDPVDRNSPIPDPTQKVGMSQDGTVAWGIGPAAWDYRQMLSHYYRKVKIGSQDNDNRWVWLNVDNNNNAVFTGFLGDQYSKVAVLSPVVLRVNQSRQMLVQIQNTGDVTWAAGGASPVRLSYHWYDSQSNTVVWDGVQTSLSADVPPGGVVTLQAQLRAPTKAGTYTLKWDMKRGNTWFSAAPNNWPMHNAGSVSVSERISNAFLPHIINPAPVQ